MKTAIDIAIHRVTIFKDKILKETYLNAWSPETFKVMVDMYYEGTLDILKQEAFREQEDGDQNKCESCKNLITVKGFGNECKFGSKACMHDKIRDLYEPKEKENEKDL